MWDKPSYACLATRVPAGTPLTAAGLARVERGESALMALGLSDFRLRLRGNEALLQELIQSNSGLGLRRPRSTDHSPSDSAWKGSISGPVLCDLHRWFSACSESCW